MFNARFFSSYQRSQLQLMRAVAWGLASTATTYIHIPLPWTPVPLSMHPLPSMIAGTIFSPLTALTSQLTYIICYPLSSYGSYTPLCGPLVGYAIGLVILAPLTHVIVRHRSGTSRIGLLFLAHCICLYALGSIGLIIHRPELLAHILWSGIIPFIPGDFIKITLALSLAHMYLHRTNA